MDVKITPTMIKRARYAAMSTESRGSIFASGALPSMRKKMNDAGLITNDGYLTLAGWRASGYLDRLHGEALIMDTLRECDIALDDPEYVAELTRLSVCGFRNVETMAARNVAKRRSVRTT